MTKNKILIILAVVAVACAGILWAQKGDRVVVEKEAVAESEVWVDDQVFGDFINVRSVALAYDGFIVIRKERMGHPMDIVGVSNYVTTGTHSFVRVPLSDVGKTENALIAVLHKDDGDGVFDPQKDFATPGSNGLLASALFVHKQ